MTRGSVLHAAEEPIAKARSARHWAKANSAEAVRR